MESEIKESKIKKIAKTTGQGIIKSGSVIAQNTKSVAGKTKEKVSITQKELIEKLDQDGNGEIDSTDIIIMSLKVPGVRINRSDFLRKELYKNHTEEEINRVIETNPMRAGISSEEIEKLADETIKFERNAVSGISTALGMPGGVAMVATIPADIAQYYGYMLRTAQKLMYLYGFPDLQVPEGDDFVLDSETINTLTICLGIMYGVSSASNAIKAMARALAVGVEKKLMKTALTKGTIYPIVKEVAKWFGKKMTKEVFSGFFKKAIPVVGGILGGGLTYLSFKPCCILLQDTLRDTKLSNPNHEANKEEDELFDEINSGVIIDVSEDEVTSIEDDSEQEQG